MGVCDLIDNVPDVDDVQGMCCWFGHVERLAEENGWNDVRNDARDGLTFNNNATHRNRLRNSILGRLQSICGRNVGMVNNLPDAVFIVHGHDEGLKQHVARYIEKLQLESIILHEEPNAGSTIVEKLEKAARRACYAVILYTGDDDMFDGQKRARQNVVFEHGYFVAKLGRDKVCVILGNGVEKPGDIDGIVYVSEVEWEKKLFQELKNAGLNVDANNLY